MNFSFDLISDLHRETWPNFDWTGMPTSPYCVVAGDIACDRALVIDTLEQLSEVYQGVFYIDGNDEHAAYLGDLGASYRELAALIENIPNVVYLQDNVVVINGLAIVATNGWWTYDFDPNLELDQSLQWYQDKAGITQSEAVTISGIGYNDASYVINSINKLQKHSDVQAIVVVSHTVPSSWLIDHDLQLIDTWQFNVMGNSHLSLVLENDTQHKIKTWCFGHYHRPVDRIHRGVRFVNNCKGRGDSEFNQAAYYPKRITIDY